MKLHCRQENNHDSLNFYEQFIQQLPGLTVILDRDSKILCSNNYTAKMLGFNSESSLLGCDAHDLRCPAVENADEYIQQDQYVITNRCHLMMLDVHVYADNQQKILLTKKVPLMINGEVHGTICHCTELMTTTMKSIADILIDSDSQYYSRKQSGERSYSIANISGNCDLTPRELDCIFYLIRGRSLRQTSKLLGISARTVETHVNNIKLKWQVEKNVT